MKNPKKNFGAILDNNNRFFMKKNILIITDSYPPEIRSASQLMKNLADGLADKGHNVWVATSEPKYNLADNKAAVWPEIANENGINVLRIKTLPHHKVNFIIRGIAQILMPYIFFHKIKKNIKDKIDVAIVHSPPLPLALVAYKVKKFYGAKYILNLHDIFPQNAIDLGILKKWKHWPAIWLFEQMEKSAYKNSDLIVVPSQSHKNFLQDKRNVLENKVHIIPHWIDIEPFRKAKRTDKFKNIYGLRDKFVFLFAGVLGPSQGLDLIIDLANELKNNREICFLFTGDGTEKNRLIKIAKDYHLENVFFQPFSREEDYPWLLKDMDVGLISLTSKNTTPAVPAKITGYMAASLPVVAFLHKESDGHLIIKEANCGFSVISDNKEKALEIILKIYSEKDKLNWYGENGFKYVVDNLRKDICINKFEKLF